MRNLVFITASLLLLIFGGGCAVGPLGPPLGLGPGLDQLVFFGLLIGIAVVAWPRFRKWTSNQHLPDNLNWSKSRAVELAADRYAKGEINRDEYLKMIDDLRHGSN
jgi:uncharacterized membrane protein